MASSPSPSSSPSSSSPLSPPSPTPPPTSPWTTTRKHAQSSTRSCKKPRPPSRYPTPPPPLLPSASSSTTAWSTAATPPSSSPPPPSTRLRETPTSTRPLAGDAFDVVTRAKNALELACPGVVSCADILAVATRNLVKYVGGPFFKVRLGRKDGRASLVSQVEINLPRANASMDQMINMFKAKGLTVEELVALTGGGHTIGFTHCKEFSNRIFNFSSTSEIDPSLNPTFANRLRNMCANYHKNPAIAAFNDPLSPGTFDNLFFKNLLNGMGLLPSDQILVADPRTKPLVELYARNQTVFFETFAHAMEKTSVIGVKTGRHGEVRAQCDRFNTVRSQS
ncbi:peroxidase superfamily protein [Actinidia rufa]|uniref:Peroxidase n=1 Tax=Actinidia rufa TaxID=165716 RepID=A0A7J0DDG5_9ERIC|nr:peroxidase superfamily protein [Actinidia rufa]